MKKKRVLMITIIFLMILIVLLCLNVFTQQKFIKTYIYTELEYRGYTAQDINDIDVKHSYLGRLLGHNEWRISVVFENEPEVSFWFTYRDNKIFFQGIRSEEGTLDYEAFLDYSERYKNGTL